MDFVTIVTPNFVHFAPAMMALEHGFHVVIEKPITFTPTNPSEAAHLQILCKELNGGWSPINCARKMAGPLMVVMVYEVNV